MKCPFCKQARDRVTDSRTSSDGLSIRRRRQCLTCRRRYTTYERPEEKPLRVVKKDGSREPFRRAKILAGLERAVEKRPVSVAQLEEVVDRIELDIYERCDREVTSQRIGELVMKELRDLDQVAYVRFASVYRAFKDVSEFITELQPMLIK